MNEEILVALEIMGKGMAGIFIALTVVYIFVLLLVKTFPVKKQVENNENNPNSIG